MKFYITVFQCTLVVAILAMMICRIIRMDEDFKVINNEMPFYDCVISINVHEKPDFLKRQLDNIKENVSCKYAVVLNCNDFMFEECGKMELPDNVYIHPEPLNKNTFHGSLMHGIYNNMVFSLHHFQFDFFLVASSRNMFENDLRDLHHVVSYNKPYANEDPRPWHEKKHVWHWPNFGETLLVKYVLENGHETFQSPHEGLLFTRNGCEGIVDFLESHGDIRDDLFEFNGSVEEFALQTISVMVGDNFYYIGNGCCTNEASGTLGPSPSMLKYMFITAR